MADEDREIGRAPGNHGRRPEHIPDYRVVPLEDVERICLRLLEQKTARFLSSEEIDKRIDQRCGRRMRELGYSVSPNSDEPGELEEKNQKTTVWLRSEYQKAVDRNAKPFAVLQVVVTILAAFATFVTFVVGGIMWLTGHFQWK